MSIFLKRFLAFTSIPLVIFLFALALYLKQDVYADFGPYKNYCWKYYFQQLGDISTKKLLNSPKQYNSFIFGSSRSTSVYACYLQNKIPNSVFFHYGNWNETIGGIYAKLKLVDSLGYDIDNVFIYFDTDYTFHGTGDCSPADHYLITKTTKWAYLMRHFKVFFTHLTSDKIKLLLGMKVEGRIYPNKLSDMQTNDFSHICTPQVVSDYGNVLETDVHKRHIDSLKETGFLYPRTGKIVHKPKQISDHEKDMLFKMKSLFEKHSTSYQIVIAPIYDQLKFNRSDSTLLFNLFSGHIHDFSGVNEYTNNEYNFPDRKHFQPYVSKLIIDSVFQQNE